jgi:hypothetical protein
MQRDSGLLAHAVMDARADGAAVIWFVNGHAVGRRDFDDWTSALAWSDRLQHQNWTVGWRLAPE